MKIKDVLAALRGLDPELDCTIEILPTEQEFNRSKGAFGIPFKVEQIEGKARAVVRVSLTEIRIIKDEGNHTRMNGLPFLTDAELGSPQVLDPVTITHVLPKTYPTGTLNFAHTFPENGKFIGIVTVKNAHGQTYVSQFPFSVGEPFTSSRHSLLRSS